MFPNGPATQQQQQQQQQQDTGRSDGALQRGTDCAFARCHNVQCSVKEGSGQVNTSVNGEDPRNGSVCRCFLCRAGLGEAAIKEGVLGSVEHQIGADDCALVGKNDTRASGALNSCSRRKDGEVIAKDSGGGNGRDGGSGDVSELESIVVERFHEVVRKHFRGKLKPPFNVEARERAGFSRQWYEPLAE